MYKDNWTQPWPMGSEIYPKVHENPRAFFSSSSPIFLEPLAYGSSDWSLPREDYIRLKGALKPGDPQGLHSEESVKASPS